MDIKKITKELAEPFPVEDLAWRPGASSKGDTPRGLCLIYVTNRAIMNRLDSVLGIDGWWNEFSHLHAGVICGITIIVDSHEITKWDGADFTEIEPTKGGLSDAMKRAAVQWGIGRYLYNMPTIWGPGYLNNRGKFMFDKDWRPPIPPQFLPKGYHTVEVAPKSRSEEKRFEVMQGSTTLKPPEETKKGPCLANVPNASRPEWLMEKVGEGKKEFGGMPVAELSWKDMASGEADGGRRAYLLYLVNRAKDNYSKSGEVPSQTEKRANTILKLLDEYATPF